MLFLGYKQEACWQGTNHSEQLLTHRVVCRIRLQSIQTDTTLLYDVEIVLDQKSDGD